ncbi:MAG TPA: hypothetical protein VM266_13570 [Solirubrobacteraceae bacterium]|nr:hypothetical protein [Solirubrobacteraceae bacterium]
MNPDTKAFLAALDDLERALDANEELTARMRQRMAAIRAGCASGRPLSEVIAVEKPPLIVQLLSESAALVQATGARVRRTEAHALYREGLTMDRIARLFGVTRQRVSALLREPAPPPE